MGLLKPSRSQGNTRLYTDSDLERLEVILNLTREMGVNLAGIEIILNMRDKMAEMQSQMEAFIKFVRSEVARRFLPATIASSATQLYARRPGTRFACINEEPYDYRGAIPWIASAAQILRALARLLERRMSNQQIK